jgi:hypothetical protein
MALFAEGYGGSFLARQLSNDFIGARTQSEEEL